MGDIELRFINRINYSLERRKYRVLVPYNNVVGSLLSVLYTQNLVRFYSPYFINPSYFALVFLTFSKGNAVLKQLKIKSTKSKPLYLTYNKLIRLKNKGLYYIVSTPKGLVSTLSMDFIKQKSGGICLIEIVL